MSHDRTRDSATPRRTVPPADPDFDLRPFLDAVAAALGGGANVVMQLSWPEIAYGVMESKVDSGKIFLHPFKRTRTTGTYLAVAIAGTDADRAAYRRAVNRAHAQVRSDQHSPVRYNAFDPDLQRWVAACLFRGPWDYYCAVYGEPDPVTAEKFYQHAARFATTLQVPAEMWPPTLADFWGYWDAQDHRIHIDQRTRAYLDDVMSLEFLPAPLRLLLARPVKWANIAMLPPRFRDEMGYRWTSEDERRFRVFVRALRFLHRWVVPGVVRRLPLRLSLWDLRLRRRFGLRLV